MTIRPFNFSRLLYQLLTLLAPVCLSAPRSLAQSDVQDHLKIMQPEIPRYRRVRPAFEVKADPTQKPLPRPVFLPAAPPSYGTLPEAPPPRPKEDPVKRLARLREAQRRETQGQLTHDRLVGIAKALSFVLVVGVGIAAITDIARQFRKPKRARMQQEEETDEWDS
jgi:hypothetical protein